jgi:hypothetical protein
VAVGQVEEILQLDIPHLESGPDAGPVVGEPPQQGLAVDSAEGVLLGELAHPPRQLGQPPGVVGDRLAGLVPVRRSPTRRIRGEPVEVRQGRAEPL